MTLGRVGWVGAATTATGWIILIGSPFLRLIDGSKFEWLFGFATLDIEVVSHDLILTGIGLAIIGSLQTGFGALTRFFEAVLRNTAEPSAVITDPLPMPETARRRITEFGVVVLDDGSVEVETILGTRRFASFAEAREFMDA
jgi:hypothetical protein